MPARMIINTESIVGYNNKLMQAKAGMKLGVNNDVNLGIKKAALQLMDGGPSKINPRPTATLRTQSTKPPWPRNRRGQMINKLQKKKLFQKNRQMKFQKKCRSMKCPWHRANAAYSSIFGKEMQPLPESKARYVQQESRWRSQQL